MSEGTERHDGDTPLLATSAGLVMLAGAQGLVWGSASPVVKRCFEVFSLDGAPVADLLLFCGVRFILAGMLGIAVGSMRRGHALVPKGTVWGHVLLISLFQTTIQFSLDYVGLAHTTGTAASIIESGAGFFAILISALAFRYEKLTSRKLLGVAVGFAGVLLIHLQGADLSGGFTLTGEGLILLSTISAGMTPSLMTRFLRKGDDQFLLSGWQFLLGGATITLGSLAAGGTWHAASTPLGYLGFLYVAGVSTIALTIQGTLLKWHPVSKIAVFGFLMPVFGVILSATMLGEAATVSWPPVLCALALVCAGIVITNTAPSED